MITIVVFFIVNITILILSMFSIIHGRTNMNNSKCFSIERKKTKIAYWILSAIQMWSGILIVSCYLIAGLLYVIVRGGSYGIS